MTLLTHPVRAAGTRLPVVIRSALICFALLSVNVACDDNNQMDDKRGAVDAGDDCPSGWHAASYYTEPGCDPAPSRRQVCAPDQWDAGCQQVCSCDGEIRCAAVFGNATSWDYGSSEPYSQADPFLDCELSADDDTDDTETDDLTEGGPDDTAPDDPNDDDPTDDDQTDDDPSSTTDDVIDSGPGDSSNGDSPNGGSADDDSASPDPADAGDGGPTDLPEAGPRPITDGGLGCPDGWYEADLYTEQDCSPAATTSRVCVPESWDAGCQLTCGCDGQTYCGSVWGSGQSWNYGLHVPFTSCETDGGEITPL